MKIVSNKVAEYRYMLGFTQKELGEKLGVTKTTVYNWERGRVQPDKEHQIKLIEILGVDRVELFKYAYSPMVRSSM